VPSEEAVKKILIQTEKAHDDESSGLKHVRYCVTELQKKAVFVFKIKTLTYFASFVFTLVLVL
jgi:hypothetical protein